MSKHVVAYINFYDNSLQQMIVECDDPLDAPVVAGFATDEERHHWGDVESMQDYFFDGESMVSVLTL